MSLRLKYRDFQNGFEVFDLFLGVGLIILYTFILFKLFLIVNSDEVIDGDHEREQKHGLLYFKVKRHNFWTRNLFIINLLTKMVFAVTVVGAYRQTRLQIVLFLVFQSLYFLYFLLLRPYDDDLLNAFCIAGEFVKLTHIIFCLVIYALQQQMILGRVVDKYYLFH